MEKKEKSIPLVAASEHGIAQTAGVFLCGVVGPFTWELENNLLVELHWNVRAIEGDSPVCESGLSPEGYLSRSGHVKPRLNLRGPSRKAKYSLTTDSELSMVTERWEEPLLGEDTEPETIRLQAVGARVPSGRVTACLLHNDPASYRCRRG